MREHRIAGWTLGCDPDQTRSAYSRSSRGAHDCQCAGCRNFLTVRDDFYPPSLLLMLDQLGIDKHKEAEVYEMGPQGEGRLYGGWYHFIGRVIENADRAVSFVGDQPNSPAWQVLFLKKRDLALETFGTSELVQLEFTVELPWRLVDSPDW